MSTKIKIWLNSISFREYVFLVIFVCMSFLSIFFYSYSQNQEKISALKLRAKQQNLIYKKYHFLQENSKKFLQSSKSLYTDVNSSFNKKLEYNKKMLNYICKIESSFFIDKVIVSATDIKNIVNVNIKTTKKYNTNKQKCKLPSSITLNNIFKNKKYTISSIIASQVKINDRWYEPNGSISSNIYIKNIYDDTIILMYANKEKRLQVGDTF